MDHTLTAGDGIFHYRIVGALGSGRRSTLYGNESNDIVLLKNFR